MITKFQPVQDLIVPVILCGGSGTRLWPASRQNHPKQFLSLIDDFSLLQNTLRRALRISGANASSVVIVTLCGMEEPVRKQLSEIDKDAASHILCEPTARNTAAAVALAADYVRKTFGENAIMWILPADHHIGRESALASSFQQALQAAKQSKLVTFGIKPTRPDTGYGYIRTGDADATGLIYAVDSFVEKPNLETAEAYFADSSYLWNSGMFVFAAKTVLTQYEIFAPDILKGVRNSVRFSDRRPSTDLYDAITSVPFDTAIMEKSENIAVVPCNPQWSDIGSWESLWEISDKDSNNNVLEGRAVAHNTQGCLIQSKNKLIAISGLKDIVVIESEDAILISNKSDNDSMKQLVNALKTSGAREVVDIAEAPAAAQPWTMVKSLEGQKSLQAREIAIAPGQHKTFETGDSGLCLYTVVEGKAHITIGGAVKTLKAFESLHIETLSTYTIANQGTSALKMIEVHKTLAEGIFFGQNRKTA
jgi:mannose-1-phosphate guanylyltransferase